MMTGVCAVCGAPKSNGATACPSCGDASTQAPAENVIFAPRPQGGLPESLAAALAYATVIPAVVLLLTKPYNKNEFVRFHAFQCIAIAVASVALGLILLLLANIPAINLLLIPISFIAALGIVLLVFVCMIKAYQQQTYKLPLLGDWAEKLAFRS
jgi:uncharacterized membrane protein